LGEWVNELEIIHQFLATEFKATSIKLDGTREGGLAALFLSAIQPAIAESVTIREVPISYVFDSREHIDFFSMGIHLPGFLKWGDISLAMALTGKNVTFVNPVTMSGQPVSGRRLQEYKQEVEQVRRASTRAGKAIL
jgi:hypothetical protein